jgi:hypothetical protein
MVAEHDETVPPADGQRQSTDSRAELITVGGDHFGPRGVEMMDRLVWAATGAGP